MTGPTVVSVSVTPITANLFWRHVGPCLYFETNLEWVDSKQVDSPSATENMDTWYSIAGFTDPMSSITHLAGAVVFAVLAVVLLHSAWPSRRRFWFSFVFAISAVLLLTMSFVYHMMALDSTARIVMRTLDIASVFLLIAGTFTAIHGMLFQGWRRWGVLVLMWTIAIVGITLRSIYYDHNSRWFGIGVFLAMGWVGVFSAYLVWKEYGFACFHPILIGGLLYSIGAIIDGVGWPVFIGKVWGPHETFHLFVLAALGWHWAFIAKIAEGAIPPHQVQP